MAEVPRTKLESITVMRVEDLPEHVILEEEGLKPSGFVEIRIERQNPAKVKILSMDESPGTKFRRLLRENREINNP